MTYLKLLRLPLALRALSVVAVVLSAQAARAQRAKPAGAGPSTAQLAPEVVVSATRVESREFDLPISIDAVDKSTIRASNPQINLSETLNRIPGIQVQNRQNYAQDLQISSRGFGDSGPGCRECGSGFPT